MGELQHLAWWEWCLLAVAFLAVVQMAGLIVGLFVRAVVVVAVPEWVMLMDAKANELKAKENKC